MVSPEPLKNSEPADAGQSLLPMAALLIAVILWGGSFAGMRFVLRSLNPWAVMWIRMMTALVILLPFLRRLIPSNFRRQDLKAVFTMVLLQPCLYFVLESNALKLTTSSQAGVISASVPVMVAFGAYVFLSEPLGRRTLAGLILSVLGVVLLTLLGGAESRAEHPIIGNSLEFLAMVCASLNLLIIKKVSERYSAAALTTFQVLAGSVFFSPGLYFILHTDPSVWTLQLVGILAALGSLVTLGAFGLYNWGMSRIPASRASVFINLTPVVAVFIGWTILDETLNLYQILSAGVVVAGVVLANKANKFS